MKIPSEVKLTYHARQRLDERKEENSYYNTRNLIKSSCKWYNRDDFIKNSNLYLHSLYVCRKSHQIGYITDGRIEVVYNKNSKIAITILKLDEKFLPITKFIKPEILEKVKIKKEQKRLKKISDLEYCS